MDTSDDRIIKIMGVMHAAYPNFNFLPATITTYCMMLRDLDPDLLDQAAKAHLATNKWFPAISELRAAVTDLIERACKTPSAAEAWGEVCDKMRRYGNTLYGGSVPEFSSPIVAKVVSYFGWNDLCLSENSVADRARFLQAYEVELARARENVKFLPETHQAIERLQAGDVNAGVKMLAARMTVKQ